MINLIRGVSCHYATTDRHIRHQNLTRHLSDSSFSRLVILVRGFRISNTNMKVEYLKRLFYIQDSVVQNKAAVLWSAIQASSSADVVNIDDICDGRHQGAMLSVLNYLALNVMPCSAELREFATEFQFWGIAQTHPSFSTQIEIENYTERIDDFLHTLFNTEQEVMSNKWERFTIGEAVQPHGELQFADEPYILGVVGSKVLMQHAFEKYGLILEVDKQYLRDTIPICLLKTRVSLEHIRYRVISACSCYYPDEECDVDLPTDSTFTVDISLSPDETEEDIMGRTERKWLLVFGSSDRESHPSYSVLVWCSRHSCAISDIYCKEDFYETDENQPYRIFEQGVHWLTQSQEQLLNETIFRKPDVLETVVDECGYSDERVVDFDNGEMATVMVVKHCKVFDTAILDKIRTNMVYRFRWYRVL